MLTCSWKHSGKTKTNPCRSVKSPNGCICCMVASCQPKNWWFFQHQIWNRLRSQAGKDTSNLFVEAFMAWSVFEEIYSLPTSKNIQLQAVIGVNTQNIQTKTLQEPSAILNVKQLSNYCSKILVWYSLGNDFLHTVQSSKCMSPFTGIFIRSSWGQISQC